MTQLVYNAVKCLECGEEIVSYHRHDYNVCGCPNETTVDGGLAYERFGGKDMSKVKSMHVYDTDDFEIVRKKHHRGGRGIDGTEPISWTPICDMNDEWLKAVVKLGGPEWHINIIKKEIEWRKKT
jgi:hypothetical protein